MTTIATLRPALQTFLIGAAGLGLATPAGLVSQAVVVLEDVTILPMTGEGPSVLSGQSILVRDGVIVTIAAAEELSIPEGAIRIDGGGTAYVMPGLTDAHVHLRGQVDDWIGLFPANGVTTVFNLAGGPQHLEMRERARTENWVAPTIYTTGPFVNEPRVTTPEEAEAAVEAHVSLGYDFLKIHGNLQAETYERLMDAANAANLTVIGHAPRNLPFEAVLDVQMPMVAHAEELIYTKFQGLSRAEVPAIAKRMAESGVWLTPTLSTFANITAIWGDTAAMLPILDQPMARHLTPGLRAFWTKGNSYSGRDLNVVPRLEAMLDFQRDMIPDLATAGVRLLVGTDTPLPGLYPGWSVYDEIAVLVDAGLDPLDALMAATRNPGAFIAEHVTNDESFGMVIEGARADLLVLDENPLQNLTTIRRPAGVVLRGMWLDRERLEAERDAIGARPGG